jgi:sulfite reductase (NADPH) hemoprotein beta-component
MLTALRSIASTHAGLFALTTNQNLTIAGVREQDRPAVEQLLRNHGITGSGAASALRQRSIACVALPTCGLAMAESERYLPDLITKIEALCTKAGLDGVPIHVRMSGCPNGCSRPYLAEIALVGKAPGKYNLYLGASPRGDRLNTLYRENIGEDEILTALQPLLERYATERSEGEAFGDFVIRTGVVRAMIHGRDFQRISV